jgi:non-specific protein-tyrosine kinase
MLRTLGELEQKADIVIFDAPPLLSVTDAAILARLCAGALLVTRFGRTRQEQVAQAVERLTMVDARLLGSVLNFAKPESGTPPTFGVPRLAVPADRRSLAVLGERS